MKARVFCKTGSLAGLDHTLGVETTLGKSSANDVVLNTHVVSRNHARIFFGSKKDRYFLQDRDSRNGTSLDGALLGKDPVELGSLHVITFAGKVDLIYQQMKEGVSAPSKPEAPAEADNMATVASQDALGAMAPPPGIEASPPPVQPAAQSQQQSQQRHQQPEVKKESEEDAGMKTVADSGGFALPTGLEEKVSDQSGASAKAEEVSEDLSRTQADTGGFVLPAGLETPDSPEGVASEKAEAKAEEASEDLSRTMADSGGFVAPPIPGMDAGGGAGATERVGGTGSFKLISSDGSLSFDLSEGSNVIGGSADCHITLSDESVSDKHASITCAGGKFILKNISEGWTSVNASQVSGEREVKEGDIIRIGIIQLKIKKN